MKLKFVVITLLNLVSFIVASGQSFYQFRFNFNQPKDSINYNAVLVIFENGAGLLRLRFESAEKREDMLLETDLVQEMVKNEQGIPDSNKILFNSINPRIIIGNTNTNFTLPAFVFKYNQQTDFIDPVEVKSSGNKFTNENTVFSVEFISAEQLNKNFVRQYFSEDEDFFKNLFQPVTKGLTAAEKNKKMYLIVVANDHDKTIGEACTKDMIRTMQTFTDLADYLGIKVDSIKITGSSYNKKNVQLAIKNLKAKPTDLVIFYYSGHGYRKLINSRRPNEFYRFPNLDLRAKPTDNYLVETLNIEMDIFNRIKKQHPGFNLVLSDCCNSDVETTNAIGTKPFKTKGSGVQWSEDNIRKLFLVNKPISILATAARSGQKATCNNRFGGFFSYYFKTSMENYCSVLKTTGNWDLILQDTQVQTIFKAQNTYCSKPYIPENICDQNPDYIIR